MRLEELSKIAKRRRLDQLVVTAQADIFALTGVNTDNGILTADALYTDFRYVAAARRVAPGLKVLDIKRFVPKGRRIGCWFGMPHSKFLALQKMARSAKFVDVADDLAAIRAVKTPDEIERIRAAETAW